MAAAARPQSVQGANRQGGVKPRRRNEPGLLNPGMMRDLQAHAVEGAMNPRRGYPGRQARIGDADEALRGAQTCGSRPCGSGSDSASNGDGADDASADRPVGRKPRGRRNDEEGAAKASAATPSGVELREARRTLRGIAREVGDDVSRGLRHRKTLEG